MAAIILLAASLQTHAQGLLYDQQSATGPNSPTPNDFLNIQEDQPLVQAFIPSLSAIGFVQFEFWDIANNGTNGATVYVNLWTGSPDLRSGFNSTLLGSTAPVYMPNGFVNDGLGFAGITNFYFSTPIALTSGQTYYLQPVVLSGDDPWDIGVLTYDAYPNGQVFEDGDGFSSEDFWFREGVVPEPSTLVLIGLICLLLFIFKPALVNEVFASFNWHQAFPRTTKSQLNSKRSGDKNVYFPCLNFLKITRGDLSFFSQFLLCQALLNPFAAHIRAENLDPLPLFFGNSHGILHRFLSKNMNDTLYREIFLDFYCVVRAFDLESALKSAET